MSVDQTQEYCFWLMCSFNCKYLRDEQSQAIVSTDARRCSTRTKQTNEKTFNLQWSLWAEWTGLHQWKTKSDPCWDISTQASERRCTQSIAPTSPVLAHDWKHDRCFSPLMFSEKPNAWFWCVCSTNRDSCCGCCGCCGSQKWSSKMSCGCSSCRRSSCGSGSYSGSGWGCGLGCDCGCGWRGCSRTTHWWTGCWRKDWAGNKG